MYRPIRLGQDQARAKALVVIRSLVITLTMHVATNSMRALFIRGVDHGLERRLQGRRRREASRKGNEPNTRTSIATLLFTLLTSTWFAVRSPGPRGIQ